MNNTITLNKTKTIVQLELDDCSFNPREADKVTTIYAEHKRYNFSEVETYNNCESWNEVYKNIVTEYNPVLIYPLYMLDHSCIRLSISNFNDRWDSGQVGFIFITRKDMQKYYGFKNLTSKRKELLKRIQDLVSSYSNPNNDIHTASAASSLSFLSNLFKILVIFLESVPYL